uniref:Uncharacterized protein n=1 Tax=Knipowitschia caucasica TaxID=637954 RepID=A0AAV2KT09_KNICA
MAAALGVSLTGSPQLPRSSSHMSPRVQHSEQRGRPSSEEDRAGRKTEQGGRPSSEEDRAARKTEQRGRPSSEEDRAARKTEATATIRAALTGNIPFKNSDHDVAIPRISTNGQMQRFRRGMML